MKVRTKSRGDGTSVHEDDGCRLIQRKDWDVVLRTLKQVHVFFFVAIYRFVGLKTNIMFVLFSD